MQREKLDTAAVFERVFAIYRAEARVLLPIALLLWIVPAALSVPSGVSARALSLAAGVIVAVWYQGMVVLAVRDFEDGKRDLGVAGLFRAVSPVFGPLLWTAILVGLGVVCGLILFIIPALVLATWWSVAAPVVVIEGLPPTEAIRRSRRLVHGNGWRVFSVLVVLLLIVALVDLVVFSLATGISSGAAAGAVANLIGGVLTAPLFALASAVLYLSLRSPAV